ncbi:hypothetical protein QJS10_CPB18g00728 [Acorus calamus]|uniref:Uncharacterized protein n=1 Tax=Acorus calamus TaxID=4465 RepID=A0AAV9CLC4_ACOCL|nr:hypothetical protein QJS10_CPB18g00728 [Acorus calamus]
MRPIGDFPHGVDAGFLGVGFVFFWCHVQLVIGALASRAPFNKKGIKEKASTINQNEEEQARLRASESIVSNINATKGPLIAEARGVFDETAQNMHLSWKHEELVKIFVKGKNFSQLKETSNEDLYSPLEGSYSSYDDVEDAEEEAYLQTYNGYNEDED